MLTARLTAIAALTMLAAACAVDTSSAESSKQDDVTPVAPQKTVVTKTLTLGDNDAIAARRGSLRRKKRSGLLGAAPAVQPFIPSSLTFVVDPARNSALSVTLVRGSGSVDDAVASVASSDPSVGSATLQDGTLGIQLTGKKGNTYITTYDAHGNATEKFMLLSASPRAGTLILDDESTRPAQLTTADGRVATDFQTSDADALGDMTATGGFLSEAHQGSIMSAISTARRASGFEDVNALYFPEQDVLVRLTGSSRHGSGQLTDRGVALTATLVTQGDFEQYVDFGGNLSASPLRDSQGVESGTVDMGHSGFSAVPTVNAVVLKDGRRLSGDGSGLQGVNAGIDYYDVTYERAPNVTGLLGDEEEEDIGPMHCTATAKVNVSWNSLISIETKLDATSSWNHGSPSVELKFEPHVRVGGQVSVGGKATLGCELKMFSVPLAEWGVPLLGQVKLQVPVKMIATLNVTGSAGIITPRLEIGSVADPTKPGAVGFSYTSSGGYHGINDIGVRAVGDHLKATKVDGVDPKYDLAVGYRTGISAGLELEASVKTWLFNAKVSASIADIMFGSQMHGDFTFDGNGGSTSSTDEKTGLGLFTELQPTIHVDFKFFHASFRLFKVEIPTLWISHTPKHTTEEKVEEEVQNINTTLGTAKLYTDALVLDDNRSWNGSIVLVRGESEIRLQAKNGELNLSGMPLKAGDSIQIVGWKFHGDLPPTELRTIFYTKS